MKEEKNTSKVHDGERKSNKIKLKMFHVVRFFFRDSSLIDFSSVLSTRALLLLLTANLKKSLPAVGVLFDADVFIQLFEPSAYALLVEGATKFRVFSFSSSYHDGLSLLCRKSEFR